MVLTLCFNVTRFTLAAFLLYTNSKEFCQKVRFLFPYLQKSYHKSQPGRKKLQAWAYEPMEWLHP